MPNPNKILSKTVTSRKLDCPFRLYSRKYFKSTTWTVEVKNTEHSHDATENIMAHPSFRKFNEQETSKIALISESLLMSRKIQAQLCSQRESDRPLILQDIYNQVKKIKKDKLQSRRPIDALINTLKEENCQPVTQNQSTSMTAKYHKPIVKPRYHQNMELFQINSKGIKGKRKVTSFQIYKSHHHKTKNNKVIPAQSYC
ncbi:hypothetical protein O181_018508 [Austropuccinia psidii MF-1]|uniref:Uncharacterized protein n=1 Tax=Austropuccinia psidii MF-1 TaxID=1389203 RepID=A0A9Q3GSS0_9BASI|nr:hypothetical protein [Austropuccinia psidii MF-1]